MFVYCTFPHSNTGLSWVTLPEAEPLGSGLNTPTLYSLPGALAQLSYYQPSSQASQLGRSPADGATALAMPNTSLLSASSTSPYPVYPLLPPATEGMSFQRMLQPYQVRNGMAAPLAPPRVIHPRPSPSTGNTSPNISDQLSRGHTHVAVAPTAAPTVTQPVACPPHHLPPTATSLTSHHYLSHAQPLPPSASASVTEGEHSKPPPSAARPAAPPTSSAPTQILHSTALPHPSPAATVIHTSVKQSSHSPTMFVSPLTSHTTAPIQQTHSTLLPSDLATHTVSHQPSLPLHRFAMSTPLGHLDASLDSPQPPTKAPSIPVHCIFFPPPPLSWPELSEGLCTDHHHHHCSDSHTQRLPIFTSPCKPHLVWRK